MLEFIKFIERMKLEKRQVILSNNTQEDDAQHSWRMAVMAFTLKPEIEVNIERCIKMALVHDLPEAISGDISRFDTKGRVNKTEKERKAIKDIASKMTDKQLSEELVNLWEEYEEAKTPEARFVKILDKFEVMIQHTQTDMKNWEPIVLKVLYGQAKRHAKKYGMLYEFASQLDELVKKKYDENGISPIEISDEDYQQYFGK